MRLFTIIKELFNADSTISSEVVDDEAELYQKNQFSAEDNYYGLDIDLNLDTDTD